VTGHVIEDSLGPLPPGSVRIEGYLGDKIDTCIRNRIAEQDVPELIEAFKTRLEEKLWRCEFWGKWFTSAAGAYQYRQKFVNSD